jgi:hypothetical protein
MTRLLVAVTVTLRILDLAGVPEKSMAAAERMAGEILGRSGVEVTWVNCPGPPGCRDEPGVNEFRVQIIAQRPTRIRGDMAGFAVLPPAGERYAGIYYSEVTASARTLGADVEPLLGMTLAHEIGHLLLGAKSHTRDGVMSPRFGAEQVRLAGRGELLFTPRQAAQLQAALSIR